MKFTQHEAKQHFIVFFSLPRFILEKQPRRNAKKKNFSISFGFSKKMKTQQDTKMWSELLHIHRSPRIRLKS